MIRTFRCRETKAIFDGARSKKFRNLEKQAKRRLDLLNAATSLLDLAALNSNRLEALAGDRAGQHSIRVNDQYRVCFIWKDDAAENVEIVDYH